MSSSSAGGGGDGGGLSSRPVHAYFKRLNLNANERWVEAAIAEVRRANAAGMSAILKSCYERWIGCDISTDDVQVRMMRLAVQSGASGCEKGFFKYFLRALQAIELYCSCHAAQISRRNLKKTFYKTFFTT